MGAPKGTKEENRGQGKKREEIPINATFPNILVSGFLYIKKKEKKKEKRRKIPRRLGLCRLYQSIFTLEINTKKFIKCYFTYLKIRVNQYLLIESTHFLK